MRALKVAVLIALLPLISPTVASARNNPIEMAPILFGLHIGQSDAEFSRVVKDTQCSADPTDATKNICKGTVSTQGAPTLDATGVFVAGVASELTLRSPTEQGCRWLTSEITSSIGKPVAKKRFMLGELETDMTLWSNDRLVEKSSWVIVSLCSPNGPGRVAFGPVAITLDSLPK